MSGPRRLAIAAAAVIILAVFLGGIASAEDVSTGERATQQLFYLVLIPATGIGVLVMVLIAYAVLKFRVRPGHTVGPPNPQTHNRRLETLWTVIPAIILVIVGVAAFQTLIVTDAIPPNPDVIVQINGHQWYWNFNITFVRNNTWLNSSGDFRYLNLSTGTLPIKVGLVVKIVMRSFDVNHAFYLPDFDLKIDLIPGHTNVYWFQALKPGDYRIQCAEYCGLSHYTMLATLHVVP